MTHTDPLSAKLPTRKLPFAPKLRALLGPSFILLGLGLGSGEIILWPYLASNYGLGIIWGAVIGITFQFFMNMEIERYALARGESVFVGFARKLRWLPLWFILSSFIPWMWPGIIASSVTMFAHVFGISTSHIPYLTVALLVLIGLILSLGPSLYKTVERFQKTLIFIGVPSILIICVLLARPVDYVAVAQGIVGVGDGYFLLPASIALTSFLAALAYSGAGGNLNLSQSFYIKEKGFGMGKYSGRITSILTGSSDSKPLLTGTQFTANKSEVREFKRWWGVINTEHALVFWGMGILTIILLSLLAYTTTFNTHVASGDISFVIAEANAIGQALTPAVGTFFLIILGLMMFATQMTVYDSVSRIMAENAVLASRGRISEKRIPYVYYTMLWGIISAAIAVTLSGFNQPLQLLIISAIMNAIAMFIHAGLTLWLNKTSLPRPIRPNAWRTIVIICAVLFYGGFSVFVVATELQKLLG
ncbi:hypothetical protein EOL73_04480 [Candidatus Saccharibacteria bacterium]|nr:hypothetical protein [Candidatus Saccharibacteria bacterium]NCU40981.1 hypothetical protein [Candidatus Saccharibacteria bacterium]